MKKMMTVVALAMFVSLPSVASHFEKMDKNQDGFISQDEAKGRIQKNFSELDTNGDGKLSPEELEAGKGEGGKKERPARS